MSKLGDQIRKFWLDARVRWVGYEFVMGVPSVYQPLVSLAVSELLAITPQERRMMANPLLAR